MVHNYTGRAYRVVYMPEHPRARKNGYVLEHIVAWETANGRSLPSDQIIHHVNLDRTDNSPDNLVAMTLGAHARLHITVVLDSSFVSEVLALSHFGLSSRRIADKLHAPRSRVLKALKTAQIRE